MLHSRIRLIVPLMLLAAATSAFVIPEAGGQDDAPVFGEGTRLIDRRGRIVSHQLDVLDQPTATEFDRSAFASIDDDHVFLLLENAKLQELESVTRRGEKVVRIWGTLTTYRGRNYLLLTRFRVSARPKREEEW